MTEKNECQENEAYLLERKKMAEDYQAASRENSSTDFPQLDFATFVLSLSATVLMCLGEAPDPESNQITQNLPAAKQTIDLLGLLETKTQGNLTCEEQRVLKDILFELRMKYIQKVR